MTDDERRALLIVGLLMSGASASTGFVGGRMTAPEPPAEVRLVRLPPRIVRMPVEIPPIEPAAAAAAEPAPVVPAPVVSAPVLETKPSPPPSRAIEVKPKPQPRPALRTQSNAQARPHKEPAPKPRPPVAVKALPSCAVVQREYDAMSWPERMAAYQRASPEEIAHGKRCLGF